MLIPVLIYSPSGVSCSITIRAPVLSFESLIAVLTSSNIDLSLKLLSSSTFIVSKLKNLVNIFFRPNSSRALLSSGWNRIIIVSTKTFIRFLAIQTIVLNLKITAISRKRATTRIPLIRVHARLVLIHNRTRYKTYAIIKMSITSVHFISGKYISPR